MENTNVKPSTDKTNSEHIRMPKNIRQIGITGQNNKSIYVEDYVMSYMKQLTEKDSMGLRVAVLLGYYIRTEHGKNIFVKGAVMMEEMDPNNGLSLSEEGWTSVYENIKKYFTDVEIVGWTLIGTEFFLEGGENIRKLHIDNFSGPDKILLKIDSLEKEEAFYLLENSQLVKQSGYYIYYEKNEEMQNYMVESRKVVSEESTVVDKTTPKIRTIINEKKIDKEKEEKSVMRLLYAASTLMAIIVLVIAYTMLDNHQQMKNLEVAINTISDSIVKNNIQSVEEDDSNNTEVVNETDEEPYESNTDKEELVDNKDLDNKEDVDNKDDVAEIDESEDTMDVETVSGNIVVVEEEDEKAGSEEDASETDTSNEVEEEDATQSVEKEEEASAPEPTKEPEPTKKAEPTKAPVDEKPTTAEIKYYTVQAGDSLAGIALKLYKSANYVKTIKELNGIEDENKILIGQKLIVP